MKLEFGFIYLDLQKIELEGVDWIDLAHGREKWRAVLSRVMKGEVEKYAGNVLTGELLASQDGPCSMDLVNFFILIEMRPNAGPCLLIFQLYRAHTTTHHSR